MIKAEGITIRYEIHKLIISILNKEELPEELKESIIVPIYKKGDKKTVVIIVEYHFSQLPTKFYPRLTAYAEEIVRYHQCGFRRNRSTTDHIFCIRQVLEKK